MLCCGLVAVVSASSVYFYLVAAFMSTVEKTSMEMGTFQHHLLNAMGHLHVWTLLHSVCRKMFCFLNRPDDWQFFVRVTFGSLNFVGLIIFLLLLRCRICKHASFSDNASVRTTVQKSL